MLNFVLVRFVDAEYVVARWWNDAGAKSSCFHMCRWQSRAAVGLGAGAVLGNLRRRKARIQICPISPPSLADVQDSSRSTWTGLTLAASAQRHQLANTKRVWGSPTHGTVWTGCIDCSKIQIHELAYMHGIGDTKSTRRAPKRAHLAVGLPHEAGWWRAALVV